MKKKKRVAEKYYKSKELVLELSPQLNRSLGCMRSLGSCVSLKGLQILLEKLHCEGFTILVHKKLHFEGFAILVHKKLYEGFQFLLEKLHFGDNTSCWVFVDVGIEVSNHVKFPVCFRLKRLILLMRDFPTYFCPFKLCDQDPPLLADRVRNKDRKYILKILGHKEVWLIQLYY